jgi:D-alanyl-D-alanine carboxypeptidase/D-alanyl-D-alanine-endopeptidase (penicillin-binding protein 4)
VRILFHFVLIFLCASLFSASAFDLASGPAKIKKLLMPLNSEAGFSLRDSASGKEIFESHGRNAFPPASVAKLVSSACSLKVLSPQFQFETRFGHTGKIQNGILTGDLVVAGSGDPSFVIEDLKEILERLYVVYGIHEIKGNLIFDASYFGTESLEIANGFEGDQGRAFTAELTAMPFNFNSFSIWVVPQNGDTRIEILPKDLFQPKIINKVKLSPTGATEISVDYQVAEKKILVSGKLAEGAESKAFYRSVQNPYEALAKTIFRVFQELGGKWSKPGFRVEVKAVHFQKLFTYSSRSIEKQLIDINKLSTNFGAELILLQAGAQEKGRPANFEKSRQVLEECLKSYGILPSEITLENASGLSRKSTMQPSGLTSFLVKILKADFAPEYLSTLSVLGRDGTYQRRLHQFAGQARLKSGSLSGINTLAGYIFSKGGAPLIFSLFFKCSSCGRDKLRQMEDEILRILLE